VVTAGGTREAIDPVRFISNHSSGKQGFALAQSALDRGAQVTLITAPTSLRDPVGSSRINVQSASEMSEAVLQEVSDSDVLIMAAAVSDFQSESESKHKIKLVRDPTISLTFEGTRDILCDVAELRAATNRPRIVVGFAAESQNLVENARSKLYKKQLSMIAANDIMSADAGFCVDTNRVTLLDANGGVEKLSLMTKADVAEVICDRIIDMLEI
jgi:phosphopantothenoylcysteine decarboxylase/phosphopantothenate--cysteine ligase